jgi:fatty acid desaturase
VSRLNVRDFRRIDDRRAFASIAFDYAVVFATASMASWINRVPLTLLAIVIIAGRQSALQGLVHSACHFSLFSRRRHNDALQFLFAYPVLDSVPLYRGPHLEHHRDFKLKRSDRFDYLDDHVQLSGKGKRARIWVVFIKPLLGHAGFVFLNDVVKTYADHPGHAFRLVVYWIGLLGAAWWFGCLWAIFIYWVVPLVWLYPVLDIWAELSDHLDARDDARNQEGFFFSLLLKGHETYHAVHHLYPFVPFYRLRGLHDRLREKGVVMESSRGPLAFLAIVYPVDDRAAVSGS